MLESVEKKSINLPSNFKVSFLSFSSLLYAFKELSLETVVEKSAQLKSALRKAREDQNFFENNLQDWSSKLEKLKEIKADSLSTSVNEDLTAALLHQIHTLSLSSTSGKEVPSRLQYTNDSGIYVNPRSFFVTPLWYFYSPRRHSWFWTPYKNYDVWMSVDNLIVKSGSFKDQKQAAVNIEIIKYLQENNPLPPVDIIREASKAEDRILKL